MTSRAAVAQSGQVIVASRCFTVFTVGQCAYAPTMAAAPEGVDERIRAAYATGDLTGLGALLAADARWGDDSHPNRCRGRDDVLRTFSDWLGHGVTAEVLDTDTGPLGVACRLRVHWADPADRPRGIEFFHVFMLRDGLIAEIRRYNDVRSAKHAITKA